MHGNLLIFPISFDLVKFREILSRQSADNMISDSRLVCDEYISSAVEAVEMAAAVGYQRPFQQPIVNGTAGNWTTHSFDTGNGIDEKIAAINQIAVSAVSMFGIAGNVLNLLVLTRRQLQRSVVSPCFCQSSPVTASLAAYHIYHLY